MTTQRRKRVEFNTSKRQAIQEKFLDSGFDLLASLQWAMDRYGDDPGLPPDKTAETFFANICTMNGGMIEGQLNRMAFRDLLNARLVQTGEVAYQKAESKFGKDISDLIDQRAELQRQLTEAQINATSNSNRAMDAVDNAAGVAREAMRLQAGAVPTQGE